MTNVMIGGVEAALTPEEVAFRQVAAALYRFDDCIAKCRCKTDRGLRKIIVTPVLAQYDEVSHIVLSINGSSPRGTFIVGHGNDIVYFNAHGRPRRIEERGSETQRQQHRVIMEYARSVTDATV